MARKKKHDAIDAVPVECPRCGRAGHARIERLNRAFACRSCRAKFYIDHTGSRVVGEPPKSAKARAKEKNKEETAAEGLPPKRRPNLFSVVRARWYAAVFRWQCLPRWGRIAAVAGPFLGLAWAVAVWAQVRAPDNLPDGLIDRARFVGEAFARDDGGKLRAIAAGWSGGAAADWLGSERPDSWPDVDATSPAQVDVEIAFQNEAAQEAAAMLTVYRPGGAFAGSSADGRAELRTYWTLADDGLWYLDGEKTRDRAE